MRLLRRLIIGLHFTILIFLIHIVSAYSDLSIQKSDTAESYLSFDGESVFSYGGSPQAILTYLPSGRGYNFQEWLPWAKKYGITNVRSFPPSIIVDDPAVNLFKLSSEDSNKYDLRKFNDEYFTLLRQACQEMKKQGIVIHFQFWQGWEWKGLWDIVYYNPQNNVNDDISKNAGPGEFVTMKNPVLLEHQKAYVRKILDATGDIGNTFYDIMNEIGSGVGANEEWVLEIIKTVNEWEEETGTDVLLTLNDEGGMRMGDFSFVCPGLDLIVMDLGRYDEHREMQDRYGKPTVSVRNIDWNYSTEKRRYFCGKYNLEVTKDLKIQTRGRKYWWRMYMAKVQSAGGYADADSIDAIYTPLKMFKMLSKKMNMRFSFLDRRVSTYQLNTKSEENLLYFRSFIDAIAGFAELRPVSGVMDSHPIAHSYSLQSPEQIIIYLESPNGEAGYKYRKQGAVLNELIFSDGTYSGYFYYPYNGKKQNAQFSIKDNQCNVTIPDFEDDLVIYIRGNE